MVKTKDRNLRYKLFMEIARHRDGINLPELVTRTKMNMPQIQKILDEAIINTITEKIEVKTNTGNRLTTKIKLLKNLNEENIKSILNCFYEVQDFEDNKKIKDVTTIKTIHSVISNCA